MSQPFMQLYVGDYIRDTMDLSTEEHGAYLLILMTMWAHDAKLPNDHKKLARIARLSPAKFKRVWGSIGRLFTVEGQHITQKRLKKEHKKAQEKSQKRAEAGARGGAAKALKSKEADVAKATDLLKHLPEPEPEPEEKEETNVSSKKTDDFERFWGVVPRKVGKGQARRAWKSAVRKSDPETIIDSMAQYASERRGQDMQFTAHPATWLNGERWADEAKSKSSGPRSMDPVTASWLGL